MIECKLCEWKFLSLARDDKEEYEMFLKHYLEEHRLSLEGEANKNFRVYDEDVNVDYKVYMGWEDWM